MKNDSWLKKISKNHHLYLISGSGGDIVFDLKEFLEKEWSVETKSSPDFYEEYYPTLYVEDCEIFRRKVNSRPITSDKKVFILSIGFMTTESANSLLKTFEDPPSDVFFFMISPNSERLPLTLKSRFNEIKVTNNVEEKFEKEAEDFLTMNLGERFLFSKKITEDISDEKMTRADAVAIFRSIEKLLKERYKPESKNIPIWQGVEKCLSYLMDPSSSVKIIFDQLSLLTEELKSIK